MVETLLRAGAEASTKALVLAVRGRKFSEKILDERRMFTGNHLKIVRALLDAGADVNGYYDFRPLPLFYMAAKYGHPQTARLLIERGADVNRNSPTLAAARYGHASVVQVLLEAGASADVVDAMNAATEAGTY